MNTAARRLSALAACAALSAAAHAAPVQVTSPSGGNSFGASLSHDGSRLTFFSASDLTGQNADRGYEIFLYERGAATLRQITDDPRGISAGSQAPRISGDGSRIVFQSYESRGSTGFFRSLYHDVASGRTVTLGDYVPSFEQTRISRDGQLIALNRDNDGLRILDTRTGLSGPVLAFNPLTLAMSGDGQRLATAGYGGSVTFIDVATGATRLVSPDGTSINQGPAFSDDGRTLAFSSTFDPLGTNADHNHELFLYDVDSGRYRQLTRTTRGSSNEASLSADGTRIAFTSNADIVGDNADGNQEIFVYDLLEDQFTQVTRTSGFSNFSVNPALSGDGLTLAYASTGDYVGDNPLHIPQIYLDRLPPRVNDVPEPPTLLLAAGAIAALWRGRRRCPPVRLTLDRPV